MKSLFRIGQYDNIYYNLKLQRFNIQRVATLFLPMQPYQAIVGNVFHCSLKQTFSSRYILQYRYTIYHNMMDILSILHKLHMWSQILSISPAPSSIQTHHRSKSINHFQRIFFFIIPSKYIVYLSIQRKMKSKSPVTLMRVNKDHISQISSCQWASFTNLCKKLLINLLTK